MFIRLILIAVLLPLISGCTTRARSVAALPPSVDSTLLGEIQRQVDSGPAPHSVSRTALEVRVRRSKLLSELTYYIAVYRPSTSHHAQWGAVVGVRNAEVRVIRGVEDWTSLVDGWLATSDSAALAACSEGIVIGGEDRHPTIERIIVLNQESITRNLVLGAQRAEVSRLALPKLMAADDEIWEWSIWALEPRQSVRYSCRIPTSSVGAVAILPTDTLVGIGLWSPLR